MIEDNKTLTDSILEELSWVMVPLQQLDSSERILSLLNELGCELPVDEKIIDTFNGVVISLTSDDGLFKCIADLVDKGEAFLAASDEERFAAGTQLVKAFGKVVGEIKSFQISIENAIEAIKAIQGLSVEIDESKLKLLHKNLIDFLLITYMQSYHRQIYSILSLFGIVEDSPPPLR